MDEAMRWIRYLTLYYSSKRAVTVCVCWVLTGLWIPSDKSIFEDEDDDEEADDESNDDVVE